MDEKQFNRLIDRYLRDELSDQDRDLVDRWLDSLRTSGQYPGWGEQDEKEQGKRLLEHILGINGGMAQLPSTDSFQGTQKRIDDKEHNEVSTTKPKWTFLKIAASVALVISAAFGSYVLRQEDGEKVYETEEVVTVSTGKGEKLKIELPDGSTVLLNSLSTITYLEGFSDSVRWVELAGEAFFEVHRNVEMTFVVRTGDLSTRVLGTSFNVRYRDEESQTQIALLSGSINVKTPDEAFVLEKGDLAVFDRVQLRTMVKKWNYLEDLGWKDGILHFESATFAEIKDKLERWYGVRINIHNVRGSGHFTGSFDNESLRNVLESLSFTFDFSYQLKGTNVSIQF